MEVDHYSWKLWDVDVDIIDEFDIPMVGFHGFPSKIYIEYLSHQREESMEKISQLEKFEDANIMKQYDFGPRKYSITLSLFSMNYKRKGQDLSMSISNVR